MAFTSDNVHIFLAVLDAGSFSAAARQLKRVPSAVSMAIANLEADKIDLAAEKISAGPWLDFDPATEKFTGEFAAEANKLATDDYAAGFELPTIS